MKEGKRQSGGKKKKEGERVEERKRREGRGKKKTMIWRKEKRVKDKRSEGR